MMRQFIGFVGRADTALLWVSQGIVLLLMVMITVDAVGRSVFNHSFVGVYETAQTSIVAVVYLGLAGTQKEHGHVRVENIIGRLKGRPKHIMEAIALVIGLCILSIMFWSTGEVGLKAAQIREYEPGIIDFPVWPGKLIVPFGLLLLCIRVAIQLGENAAKLYPRRHEKLEAES